MNYQRGFILPNPYFLLAAGIAIAVSFGMGYWRGWSSGMERYYDFKSSVEQAQEQIRIEQERRLAEAKRINDAANQGWANAQKELDSLRKRGSVIRVQPCSQAGKLSAIPSTGQRLNGSAAELGSGAGKPEATEITVDRCESIANKAVEDAAQVLWLTDWIEKQHKASLKR